MRTTTHDLWLEDLREVRERSRERTWWACLRWATGFGLASALVMWGWRGPVIASLGVAVFTILVRLPLMEHPGRHGVLRLVDDAAVVGLACTAAAGLVLALGIVGVGAVALLALTCSAARHAMRQLTGLLRSAQSLARDTGLTGDGR